MAKAQRPEARNHAASGSMSDAKETSAMLKLPVGVLHQVLDMLSAADLMKLMQTSAAMAAEVMQHSAGRITYKIGYNDISMENARGLLQWAPPACLKLELSGYFGHKGLTSWGELSSLLHVKPKPTSCGQVQAQQFACLVEVCFKHCRLPSLVPADLAAICPNMHTLHLCGCMVICKSNGSSIDSEDRNDGACSSSIGGSCSASPYQARQLHTLVLEGTHAPQLQSVWHDSAKQYAEQLRRGIPNVSCLKSLHIYHRGVEFVLTVSSQLRELHSPDDTALRMLQRYVVGSDLPQLQKLVLPQVCMGTAWDISFLLSLPSLTHVELGSVSDGFAEDYSSHACKWQYLQLHLPDGTSLQLGVLAKLPLHSLTQPLTLGNGKSGRVRVRLPTLDSQRDLAAVQQVANKLMCGDVQLLGSCLAWSGTDAYPPLPGAKYSTAFELLAPAFGPQATICMSQMTLDQAIVQSLATVYGQSLQCLEFCSSGFELDNQAVWQPALTSLPALHKVDLCRCYYPNCTVPLKIATSLAAAMARQPAGRRIELVTPAGCCMTPEDIATLVVDVTTDQEAIVDVKATAMNTDVKFHLLTISKPNV